MHHVLDLAHLQGKHARGQTHAHLLLVHVVIDQAAKAFGLVFTPPAILLGITQLELAPLVPAALWQAAQAAADLRPPGALLSHQLPQLLTFLFAPLALHRKSSLMTYEHHL